MFFKQTLPDLILYWLDIDLGLYYGSVWCLEHLEENIHKLNNQQNSPIALFNIKTESSILKEHIVYMYLRSVENIYILQAWTPNNKRSGAPEYRTSPDQNDVHYYMQLYYNVMAVHSGMYLSCFKHMNCITPCGLHMYTKNWSIGQKLLCTILQNNNTMPKARKFVELYNLQSVGRMGDDSDCS